MRAFFLDKVSGTPSMVRLIAFLLTLDASAVTGVICYVATHGASVALIVALTSTLTALVASGIVALVKRTTAISAAAKTIASALGEPSPVSDVVPGKAEGAVGFVTEARG